MTPRPPVRSASLALASAAALALLSGACLEETYVPPVHDTCTCSGFRCLDGVVGRLQDSDPDEPCRRCHVNQLGICAEGCGGSLEPIEGCPVAFACKTWSRVTEGAACANVHDCEPGVNAAGEADPTLACVNGVCTASPAKFPVSPVPAKECSGGPEFGPHPACAGAACVATENFATKRYCSAAKCLSDKDCPTLWRCRCGEENQKAGVVPHRWCVPDFGKGFPQTSVIPENKPDAGSAPDAASPGPDAGPDAGADAGADAGEDAGSGDDAGDAG